MMLASSDEPDILASGVMANTMPASVAMMTIHVVVVRNDVVGKNDAPYCDRAETKRAVPSKKKSDAKSIGFFFSSLMASLFPTSSMTEVSALVHRLNLLAKGTRAKSIIIQIA